jgi:hypothetical protein
MLERIRKEQEEKLLKEQKAKDKMIPELIKTESKRLKEPELSIEFNKENNIELLNEWFHYIQKELEIMKQIKKNINEYKKTSLLTSSIEKKKLYNELKQLEKELITHQQKNALTYFIGFSNFKNINFATDLDRLKPTTSFIDLKNKKAMNNRIDNNILINGNVTLSSQNVTLSNDNVKNILIDNSYVTQCIKQKKDLNANIKINIVLNNPIKANRLVLELLYSQNTNLNVKIKNKKRSITLINDIIFKTYFDRVFEHETINEIEIIIENKRDTEFNIGINQLKLYEDKYETNSIICSKKIRINQIPFKFSLKTILFPGTIVHTLIGVIKDNKVSWKAVNNESILNYLADEIIVLLTLEGSTYNTPIVEYAAIELLQTDLGDSLLNPLDYNGGI